MHVVELVNTLTGTIVCKHCEMADKALPRMRGLLGRDSLAADAGMLFNRTGSVHTFRMRFPIDVVFLDADLAVLAVHPSVRPGKAVKQRGAKWTLELAAGAAAANGVEPGVKLRVDADAPVRLERRNPGSVGATFRLAHEERRAHPAGAVVGERAPQDKAPRP